MIDPTPFLGIPFEVADCVQLTLRYLRSRGIDATDPRLDLDAWEPCTADVADVATSCDRKHIAAIVDGRLLHARRGNTSCLLRMPANGIEFWRFRR